jgi:MFS family permease
MVYPILPVFIVGVLKAPARVLGITEGLADALVSFMKGWSGWHSDRTGKRLPYIRYGYGLAAVAKPITGLATAWPLVTFARSLDRFGKGLRGSARDAMIADEVEPGEAGRAFGYHRAFDSAGAVLGTLCGFFLVRTFEGRYREMFLIAAVPGLAAWALTLVLREKREVAAEPASVEKADEPLTTDYYRVLALLTLFAVGNSSDTFLLLRASDVGLSAAHLMLLYTLFNVAYASFSYPLGGLSDRAGRLPILIGGWLVYAIVYAGFAVTDARWVWVLMPVYGLYLAATDGVGKSLIARHSPTSRKGSGIGLMAMVTGFASLAASFSAGWLWDMVGHAAPFWFGAAVALVTAVVAPFLVKEARATG